MSRMPTDAICTIGYTYYKLGEHGKAYRWNGDEWILSNKPMSEILKAKGVQKHLRSQK